MAEVYVPYTLATPLGTLTFNPVGGGVDGLYLQDVAGLDSAALRATVDNRPTRDGGIVYDGYLGAYYPILSGYIRNLTTGTWTARRQAEDAMRAACFSIKNADGTLTWTPTGGTSRSLTVRLYQPLAISNNAGPTKDFQIALVASKAYTTETTVNSQDTGFLGASSGLFTIPFSFPINFGSSAAGNASVTVGGAVPAYPKVRIFGACSAPKILNTTTGLYVSLPTLSIAAGQFVDVDMAAETVTLGGVTSVIGKLDFVNSQFWSMAPGVNAIKLIATGFDTNAKATITWANSYA